MDVNIAQVDGNEVAAYWVDSYDHSKGVRLRVATN